MATVTSQFPNVQCMVVNVNDIKSELDMAIARRTKLTPSMFILSNTIVELIMSRRGGFAESEILGQNGVPELDSGLLAFVRLSLEKLMNPVKAGISMPYSLPSSYITRR